MNLLKTPLNLILLWTLLMLVGNLQAQSSLPIVVGSDKTSQRDLFGYSQDIEIQGVALENVSCIMGTVYVRGVVRGSISVLFGDVVVLDRGRVDGNIVCLGGTVKEEGLNAVGGKVTNFSPDLSSQVSWTGTTYAKLSLFFGHGLLLFLLVTLLFYAVPNHVNEAGFHLSQDLRHAAVIGAVTWAALGILYFLSFVLMTIAIGFPLLLLTLMATAIITIFGTSVVFYQLGSALEHVTNQKISLNWGILISILLASVLIYIPVVRELVLLGVALFGAGTTMETRFGTNKQWFTRKARYWSAG